MVLWNVWMLLYSHKLTTFVMLYYHRFSTRECKDLSLDKSLRDKCFVIFEKWRRANIHSWRYVFQWALFSEVSFCRCEYSARSKLSSAVSFVQCLWLLCKWRNFSWINVLQSGENKAFIIFASISNIWYSQKKYEETI